MEILNENEDMVLEDNYFDMNAGEKRVRIISGEPEIGRASCRERVSSPV